MRWDTEAFFSGLDGDDLAEAIDKLKAAVERFGGDVSIEAANDTLTRARLLQGYAALFTSTDAMNDRAAALEAELRAIVVPVGPLLARLDRRLADSEPDADHAFYARRACVSAQHQLPIDQEELAAELDLSGGAAWAKLYRDTTSRIVVDVPGKGELPIAAVRALAGDPDAAVRRSAYEAELAAWQRAAVPVAATLNGVKGQATVLDRRRGWPDSLAPALHANNVDRAVLDALNAAVTAALPDFRRVLRAKARALGHGDEPLPWWDITAPLPQAASGSVSLERARDRIAGAFATYSGDMRALAERAFAERWIDAEPRAGKRDGAFCMGVRGGVSRVMANFTGRLTDVTTLAHELGHAFHNHTLAGRTELQRQTPMALAETASTFCETVMFDAELAEAPDDATRLALLEHDLQRATQIVVDIHSRFTFESELMERRAARPLSVAELCDAMRRAQQVAFGDAVDGHPYMWAAKPHYYQRAFYNWPYTFGLLFGTGLFAAFRADPAGFPARYEDLLSRTGMASARDLAAGFGFDIADPAFWSSALDVMRARIEAFERAVAG